MVGERLRALRAEKGLTQMDVGEAIGVTDAAVGMWETGKRVPDAPTLAKLAQLFGVSVDYLLGRSDDPAQPVQVDTPPEVRAIFRASQNLTPEERRSVLDFIEFMRSRRGGGSDSQAAPERGPGP